MKRFTLAICALLLSATLLSACNTVEGVGEDVQAGGRGIERGANQAR